MKYIFQLVSLFISFQALAQKEASWTCDWRYHLTTGLETGHPDARKFSGEANPDDLFQNQRYLFAISDKKSGQYKAFTDGHKVWDTSGALLPNGVLKNRTNPVDIDYTTIIPLEEYDQKRGYVISRHLGPISPLPEDPTVALYDYQLSYAVVDFTKNEGKGEVLSKAQVIVSGQDIRYEAGYFASCGTIKHSDGISTWLIMKHSMTDSYYVFLANACGIKLHEIFYAKDIIPHYNEIYTKHRGNMELYYNGYLMDVRKKEGVTLNYFFQFDRKNGELTYYKHFNFKERYAHWFEGYERYWMYLTDSLYFYTGGFTANEDLVFYQFDLKNTPSGDIDPFYSYFRAKEDIPVLQSIPEARIRDARIYPYTQGRVFLCAAILYSGGNSGTNAQIFAEFKSPQKKCPDCDLGPFVLQLENDPERPGIGQNNYWYTYWLHNRTHFSPDWEAPEMGTPEIQLSKSCADEVVTVSLADSLRGDSLLVFTSSDTIIFYGDENKVLAGQQSSTFQHPGKHTIMLTRYINCVADTFEQTVEIAEAPDSPSEIIQQDTIYSCEQSTIEISLKAEKGLNYSWSNGQTGISAIFNKEGTYTITAFNECGEWQDTLTIIFPEHFIPNLITPNQDNMNDFFVIDPREWENGQLEIYNRWGNRVFKSDSYNHNWPIGEVKEGIYYYLYRSNRGGCEGKGWLQVIK